MILMEQTRAVNLKQRAACDRQTQCVEIHPDVSPKLCEIFAVVVL